MNARQTLKFAIVSTYPPTPCGIATFAAALSGGLVDQGQDVGIVRLGATGDGTRGLVEAHYDGRSLTHAAAESLERADVVVLQHEYGIYPGPDGDSVVGVLESIDRPTIVVAHTVLEQPTPHQRAILEEVVHLADAVVVMTEAGRTRLCSGFDVDPSKVSVIPHGATVAEPPSNAPRRRVPQLLTWGLLGPGKGIEWAIDALALLDDVRPRPTYRIAGDTHPKVVANSGESYRDMLKERSHERGVAGQVEFDAGYRELDDLAHLIAESSIVVLPYDSPDQVTSGVLVDAIAAGRPVIATAFPHAVELLSSGAGVVVPQRDPQALAHAIRMVLTNPRLAESMAREARRLAPSLAWSSVAARYASLGGALMRRRTPVAV